MQPAGEVFIFLVVSVGEEAVRESRADDSPEGRAGLDVKTRNHVAGSRSEKPAGAAAEEGGAIGEVEDSARNGLLQAAETPPLPAPRASGGDRGRRQGRRGGGSGRGGQRMIRVAVG